MMMVFLEEIICRREWMKLTEAAELQQLSSCAAIALGI
jgi:hypothetical protein